MNLSPERQIVAVARMAVVPLIGFALADNPAASQERPKMSDEAFKNIQALKGLPVDDLMGTMGIMSASLGFDCAECHQGTGTDRVDWAADTPGKVMARRMVNMVTTINRDNFQGRQVVTRYGKSPIGRVPTQIDFANYRDVGGINMPHHLAFAWLDGRDSITLNDVKINVPVDEGSFGKPAPLKMSLY